VTTVDTQERLKEEAKVLHARIRDLVRDLPARDAAIKTLMVYAGLITETLLEYEEPDTVMEQTFHRICDLLHIEPAESAPGAALMPLSTRLDHDTELGRALARSAAKKLSKKLDDVHEVAIGMIISDMPLWSKDGLLAADMMRLLIESVITALTFEMATQEFCDMIIEDYVNEGHTAAEGILGLGAAVGYYFERAREAGGLGDAIEDEVVNVMARESKRHGVEGPRNWTKLGVANDIVEPGMIRLVGEILPEMDEFFDVVGLDDRLSRAVAAAKALGRMVAVASVEDVGQIHPSTAKSLAKTGMILGKSYKDNAVQ